MERIEIEGQKDIKAKMIEVGRKCFEYIRSNKIKFT